MSEKSQTNPVITRVMAERDQLYSTRQDLFRTIEEKLGRPVVTYFTSIRYPVGVNDQDVDMLEGLFQAMDLSAGLALMVSSLGGDALAAERLINVCRCHSGTGEFWAIVPGQAKSAATMICLGASKIHMGPASELGSVDPQVVVLDDRNRPSYISAFHVVRAYETLFSEAVRQESGNLEPYLQQLARYDAGVVAYYRSLMELSRDISVKALKSGSMSNLEEGEIEERIKVFLVPEETKTHGRPIFRNAVRDTGVGVEDIDTASELGQEIYELYTRSRFYADRQVSKLVESKEHAVYMPVPQE